MMGLNLELPDDFIKDLDFYIKNVKSIQSLSKDEECILTKNFKEKNDTVSFKRIVESNIGYIIKIARSYIGYIDINITLKDLVHEGVIGLIKAINNFNPDKNVRLVSFAIFWIKSEIHDYIIKNLRLVQIANTKSQRKVFFNLKKFKKSGWLNNDEVSIISRLLNVKSKDIDYIQTRLNKNDISLDSEYDENQDHNQLKKNFKKISSNNNPLSILEEKNWIEHIIDSIKNSIDKFETRDKEIFVKRWLKRKRNTLKNLAEKYNISSERVRQLENLIIERIKNSVYLEK